MRALSFLPALLRRTQQSAQKTAQRENPCRCTVFVIKSFLRLLINVSLSLCVTVNQPPETPLNLMLYSHNL